MPRFGQLVFLTALVALGASSRARAADAPADAIAQSIDNLSSGSYAEREAAQKALLATPLDQIEHVRELAAHVTDAEAVTRLHAILGALDSIEVTSTPGLTVDVHDATLDGVAAAMSKSAGVTIGADNNGSADRFTLSVAGQPLWEVIDQLSQQHPLGIADRDGLVLRPSNSTTPRHRQVVRGVLFSISEPNLGGFAGGVRPRAWPSNVNVVVALDPRISLFQAHAPILTSVKDAAGQEVPLPNEAAVGQQVIPDPSHIWSRDITLGVPPELGDKLTIAGRVAFSAIVRKKPVELAEPAKHVNESLRVGALTVALKQVLATDALKKRDGTEGVRALGIKLEVAPAAGAGLPPDVGDMRQVGDEIRAPSYGKRSLFPVKGVAIGNFDMGNDDLAIEDGVIRYDGVANPDKSADPLEIVAVDATGRKIMAAQLTVNAACTVISAVHTDYKDPITLELRTGVVRQAMVPFEFKDVPVAK